MELLFSLVTVVFLINGYSVLAQGDWQEARATFYGEDGGATIHEGSCMYYNLDPNVGTGWDIAALSDRDPAFAGSCGSCYEVACRPAKFKDAFGQYLDRESACKDPSKTVVVRITDSCPCYYPANRHSNSRWCCGDTKHFDLSVYAWRKIADEKYGAIGIKYRRVKCPGEPLKPAGRNPGNGAMKNNGETPDDYRVDESGLPYPLGCYPDCQNPATKTSWGGANSGNSDSSGGSQKTVSENQQCGGKGQDCGSTCWDSQWALCSPGTFCVRDSEWWWSCKKQGGGSFASFSPPSYSFPSFGNFGNFPGFSLGGRKLRNSEDEPPHSK